jgi:hypothetical protein
LQSFELQFCLHARAFECRQLSAEQREKYKELVAQPHDETTCITHDDQKVEVAFAHLATCAKNQWLADPIMNCYMALLQA